MGSIITVQVVSNSDLEAFGRSDGPQVTFSFARLRIVVVCIIIRHHS